MVYCGNAAAPASSGGRAPFVSPFDHAEVPGKMDAKTLAQLKEVLLTEHVRLATELADLERDSATNLSDQSGENNYRDHMADQGTATFGKELEMSLEENARQLFGAVSKALERIDAGTYGQCVRCGDDIPVDRLKAMPAAELCISCKEWEEGR
jgi:DnaK suppressor protein